MRCSLVLKSLGLPPQRVVLEVPEQAGGETTRFAEIVDSLRKSGFLIALDGFGVKHSNIDRVWHLRPDIVTLDRCILAAGERALAFRARAAGTRVAAARIGTTRADGRARDRARRADCARMQRRFRAGRVFRRSERRGRKRQAAAGLMDALRRRARARSGTRAGQARASRRM